MNDSDLGEQGTTISGYEEKGKYHCGDCIHRVNPSSDVCVHPVVICDPQLKDRLVRISGDEYGIRVNLEKGCCSYVNQTHNPSMLVLRHGETGLNKTKKFRSLRNVPLNEDGIAQAEAAAQFLKNYPIKKIICSPLDRAYHTALMVQEALGEDVPVTKDRSLLPWDLGELAGKSRKDNASTLQYYIDHSDEPVPEGQSLDDFTEIMFKAFDKRVAESSWEDLTLIVGHTSTITTLNEWADDNYTGKPETDDESVEPGGVVALVPDLDKAFKVEPIWGIEKKADFGS